jgi:hypothetical protein
MKWLLAVALLAPLGCGGSSSPPGLIGAFQVAGSGFSQQQANGFIFRGMSTILEATSFANTCDQATQGVVSADSKLLRIALAEIDDLGVATPAATAGVYAIVTDRTSPLPVGGAFAQAFFVRYSAGCVVATELEATAGSIIVTRADGTMLEGTINISAFVDSRNVSGSAEPQPTGDLFSGAFSAAVCPALTFNSSPTCS